MFFLSIAEVICGRLSLHLLHPLLDYYRTLFDQDLDGVVVDCGPCFSIENHESWHSPHSEMLRRRFHPRVFERQG